MDSRIPMFTITKNGDKNDSLVEEGIARPRGIVPDTEFQVPVTDVSDSDVCRTPEKRWCPKRRRMTRTTRLRIEGDTDHRTLHFEEFKVSVEDAEVIQVQHPTPSKESFYRARSLLHQMTPQDVKYRRSKKRRR
jgi:hypothetical protein